MKQALLPLISSVNYSEETWNEGISNKEATQWIFSWPHWGKQKHLCLWGENGVGKTHLLNIWREKTNAYSIESLSLKTQAPYELPLRKAYVIDDVDYSVDDFWLFSFYNWIVERDSYLLLTSHTPPSRWTGHLPDLISRLSTIQSIMIQEIDDQLFHHILKKQFLDEGFIVNETVLEYLTRRIERNFKTIRDIVKEIVAIANISDCSVTIPMIKEHIRL